MNDKSLSKQPSYLPDRSSLRTLFREFLQPGGEGDKPEWESITTRNGLPHNWIYDLFQDSRGRIWVGTWGGGLARFDHDQWTVYSNKDGLHCNEVTCIKEDVQGRIWIATDQGLNRFEEEQIVDAGLKGKSLLNITFDQQGHLWAGCWRSAQTGAGLYHYDGAQWELFTTRSNMPGLEILKLFKDSKDQIWVGTYEHGIGAGVGRYDGKKWVSFTHRDGLVDDCVYSMFEDPGGNMWFGTVEGVSIFDGRNWHTLTTKDGLVDNRVYSMLIDRGKKMWFGTEGGISRFDGEQWMSYTNKDGLVENLVRSILEAADGSLWFGTYPYERGRGGISIARYPGPKSLPDRVVHLLPDIPKPKQLESGQPDQESI